jgi:uncharacterized protein YjeT (DUF2065 family)
MPPVIRNPKPAAPARPAAEPRLSPQQARTLRLLAGILIAGGVLVLALLERMPLPLRLIVGLTDIVAGLGLLVFVRQKI